MLFQNRTASDTEKIILSPISKNDYQKGACAFSFLHGSMTVEAALTLTLFMFAAGICLMPLKALNECRKLQNVMEAAAKDLAQAAYFQKSISSAMKPEAEITDFLAGMADGIGEAAVRIRILSSVNTAVLENPVFDEETAILSQEEGKDPAMIYMELRYYQVLPCAGIFFPGKPEMTSVVNRRAWVGADGGRGREAYADEEDNEDMIVYVGKHSTRYHTDPGCHYLSNDMKTADISVMDSLRNESGHIYHACSECRPVSGTVYYFREGTAYHSKEDCRAITAYVEARPLSEVAYLGACSYCSGERK